MTMHGSRKRDAFTVRLSMDKLVVQPRRLLPENRSAPFQPAPLACAAVSTL